MTDRAAAARAALAAHTPRGDREAADLAELLALTARGDPWDRATALHLTASALVVHPPTARVLLRWHARQGAWLQVGGHADPGETDPPAVALREAREETGLTDLAPWPPGEVAAVLHAVVVPVAPGRGEPAHRHGDIRYLLATMSPGAAVPEDASAHLRWLSFEDAAALTSQENLRESLSRARDVIAGA